MSTPNDVLIGLWVDYGRGKRPQILASDFWALWMKTMVAVGLTLSTPYVFKISKSFFISFKMWWDKVPENPENRPLLAVERQNRNGRGADAHRGDNPAQQDGEASQDRNVRESEDAPPQDEQNIGDILKRSLSGRETLVNLVKDALQKGSDFSGAHATVMIMIATTILALFVVQIIANVFSANIATDRAARSSSRYCGIWLFDDENAGDEAALRADVYDYQKEERAGEYAENCYGSHIVTDSMRCDFFYRPRIPFTSRSLDKCPFNSHQLCLGGLYSAVTFDTGLVDVNHIGINSKVPHKFRRTTTCSPLNMDYPYMRNESTHNSTDTTYYYYYGRINDYTSIPPAFTNYTYTTSGNPFEWLAPVYSVNTYSTSLYPEMDYWQPILELAPPQNSTLTIIFVSSMHIYHFKRSDDPIFPATHPHYVSGYRNPYFYNSDPRARALACVDTTELCSPDGTTCWSTTASVPDFAPKTSAYWFMKWALESSTTYDSIKWRLGTALLAQEKVSQSISQPLNDSHWEAEARQLFATSLARIQFDAWSIARGEDHEKPGYIEVTPDEGRGKLCGLYKFNSIGYTNVNLGAFVGLLLTPLIIFFCSLEVRTVLKFSRCFGYEETCDADGNGRTHWEPLVATALFKYLLYLIFFVPRGLFSWVAWLYRKLH